VGFSTEQRRLDRLFDGLALMAAQPKATSIAEIARAVPILAPDNSLISWLGVSALAVRLSSDELDRFLESLPCAPVALSKTTCGTDDAEGVNHERPMNFRYQPAPDTQPDSYARTIGGQLSGNICGRSPLAAIRGTRGGGWQRDRGRDGRLSQGSVPITRAPRALSRKVAKLASFWLPDREG
jgi:hypothetical protein